MSLTCFSLVSLTSSPINHSHIHPLSTFLVHSGFFSGVSQCCRQHLLASWCSKLGHLWYLLLYVCVIWKKIIIELLYTANQLLVPYLPFSHAFIILFLAFCVCCLSVSLAMVLLFLLFYICKFSSSCFSLQDVFCCFIIFSSSSCIASPLIHIISFFFHLSLSLFCIHLFSFTHFTSFILLFLSQFIISSLSLSASFSTCNHFLFLPYNQSLSLLPLLASLLPGFLSYFRLPLSLLLILQTSCFLLSSLPLSLQFNMSLDHIILI